MKHRHWFLKRLLCGILALVFALEATLWAGLGSNKAEYVGGTVATLRQNDEGILSTEDQKTLLFKGDKKQEWQIPYERVT